MARWQEEQAASMDRQVKSKDAVMVKSSPVNVTKAENGSKLVLENFSLLSDCLFFTKIPKEKDGGKAYVLSVLNEKFLYKESRL